MKLVYLTIMYVYCHKTFFTYYITFHFLPFWHLSILLIIFYHKVNIIKPFVFLCFGYSTFSRLFIIRLNKHLCVSSTKQIIPANNLYSINPLKTHCVPIVGGKVSSSVSNWPFQDVDSSLTNWTLPHHHTVQCWRHKT